MIKIIAGIIMVIIRNIMHNSVAQKNRLRNNLDIRNLCIYSNYSFNICFDNNKTTLVNSLLEENKF